MAAALSQPFAVLHRRLCAALLCLGVGVVGAFGEERRERKDVAVPPPQPVPQQLKVERGSEVLIPLRIYGQRNQVLTFLIRKPPRTGRLSGLKNTSANAAVVHYRPTDDHNIDSDVFEYAVKSIEGVSAAVPVEIEIIDQPPELAGPAEVLFPPRLVGTSETQTIELINRGGMTAEGECRVDLPWRLESPATYRIEPGGRLFAKVTFAPERAGDFLGDLRFSSQPERSVVLRGIARDALAVKPSPLQLSLEPTTLVRAGVFEVTNHTDSPQRVQIRSDRRLHFEPELQLDRGQTAPVMVRTAAEDAAPLNAEIVLEAGAHRAMVPVTAVPLPAVIRAVDRMVDLGLVPGGTVAAGELSLRNVGGTSGWATVSVSSPFRVSPQRIDLAPGATVAVPITVEAVDPGAAEQTLQVRTANGTFGVAVRAIVVAPGSAPPRTARTSSELPSMMSSAPPATPMPASIHDLDLSRPDVKLTVRPVVIEPSRCVLEWHSDLSSATEFIAERRELLMQSGELSVRWESMPGFRVERIGEKLRGVFERLVPSHRYTVRVIEIGPDQKRGSQIFQTSFDTPLGRSQRGKSGLFWIAVLAAMGLGGVVWWRRCQPPERPTRTLKKTERIV